MQVVALHGFASTEAQWAAVAAALPATIRLRTVALPGHANGPPVGPSWHATVEQLAQVINPPSQPPAGLVIGYSLGARLTLGLVAAGHVEHAMLVSVNPGLQREAERAARRSSDAAWATLLRTEGIAEFARAWQAQALFDSQQQVSAALRSARASQRLRHDPTQLADALICLGLASMPDYRRVIAAHQHRIHLVVGALDSKFVAIAQQLTTAHPDVQCTEIPGCGHDPTLESPTVLAQLVVSAATTIYGRGET